MAAAIAITRLDLSASELRAAAGEEKNGGAADAGLGPGAGRVRPDDRGEHVRQGSADAARLGSSLQPGRACGPAQPRAARGPGEADGGAEGGAGETC